MTARKLRNCVRVIDTNHSVAADRENSYDTDRSGLRGKHLAAHRDWVVWNAPSADGLSQTAPQNRHEPALSCHTRQATLRTMNDAAIEGGT
jgi:hypothetical protein